MMKYCIAVVVSTLLFVSCKEEDKPQLSREEMLAVLQDIHFAEVYSTMVDDGEERTTNKNIDSLAKFYKIVFKQHNITQEEFNASAKWYALHPAELDSVYTQMLTDISEFEGVLEKEKANK